MRLVRKPMYRFTAKMSMEHQFLASLGEHDHEVKDEGLLAVQDEKLVSTLTDFELTDSSISSDWLLLFDDSSYCSSWPEEDEDLEVQCHGRSDKNESFASSLNGLTSTGS
ncbi:hypothetical protein I3760_13G091700 [Carya illinoinensis]|nr:hypothetical protein I3760_13G091700 [Carya illinoinensis]